MRTRNKTSHWTLRLTTVFALAVFALMGCVAFNTTGLADGNDLGTSPFDFTDAVYSAQGIVPENIVLRAEEASPVAESDQLCLPDAPGHPLELGRHHVPSA